ncbi:polyphosphate glucokinase [Rhodothermaceae bacterium RA]|nr:polyphosphate glucokinase [Rhodothermaceae bacterium RA]
MQILGIDIGGSGIKGAPVDLENGRLLTERHRIATPQPATPTAVADVVRKITRHFDWSGPVGCAFPARIKHGKALTAANVDDSWLNTDVAALFAERTGCPTTVLNDADAAGLAEMTFGAGRGRTDLVLLLTFGTGIGSALFIERVLVPNTELGHIILHGKDAEPYAADRARKEEKLSWKRWARRVQEYLDRIEFLLSPDLIIIGGGVSKPKRAEKFLPYLHTQAELVTAQLRNEAGIVGAALHARSLLKTPAK